VIVVIPTLAANLASDDALSECLRSLRRQSFTDFETVVVDNSGRGLVLQSSRLELGTVRVLEMPRNVGFGAAINAAWEQSGARYLATLNDDAVASPQWLASLVATAERTPQAGMFASCVSLAGQDFLDSAGMLLCADGSSKQRGHGEPISCYPAAEEVLLPSASAALYRGEMLRKIGTFDAEFFLYCEDTDLGLRARRGGWSCMFVPDAKVEHRYSHSAGRVSALKAYYVERNRLFVVVKNFPFRMVLLVPFIAAVRYCWHIIFLMQGKGAAAQFASENGAGWRLPLLVLKAHLATLWNLPRLLRQRAEISTSARVAEAAFRTLLRHYSISPRDVARH